MNIPDLVSTAIANQALFTGVTSGVDVSANPTCSSFGVYNPRGSGKNILIFSMRILVGGTQPITVLPANSGTSAFFVYARDVNGSTVTPPSNTNTTTFKACFAAANTNSVLQRLTSTSLYVTPATASGAGWRLPRVSDLQPQQELYLEDLWPIQTLFPLILYPGDFFGSAAGIQFNSSSFLLSFVTF